MAFEMKHNFTVSYLSDRVQYDESFQRSFPEVGKEFVKSFTLENAYFKIDKIEGTKEELSVLVVVYKDKSKGVAIESSKYHFNPSVEANSDNFIKQGYEYLKTLPEFSGAVDI